MSIELGRRLLASELITHENLRDALHLSVARGISLPRALIDCGIVTAPELDDEIARLAGPGLRYVQGSIELVAKLPRSMPRRLSALPTRTDPQTGIVDIAAADPFDPHIGIEMAFHLNAHVRVLRASIGAVEEAIRRIEVAALDAPADAKHRLRRFTPALPYGAPSSVPPPAPSTPIPLVAKRTGSVPLDDADTHVDDLSSDDFEARGHALPNVADEDESEPREPTALWGTPVPAPATLASAQRLNRTLDLPNVADEDESEPVERTAAWGTPVPAPAAKAAPAPVAPVAPAQRSNLTLPNVADEDESEPVERTLLWGASAPAPAATAAPTQRLPHGLPNVADEDESEPVERTLLWGTVVPAPAAPVVPAQRLNRTLDYEDDAPRTAVQAAPPPPPVQATPPPPTVQAAPPPPPVQAAPLPPPVQTAPLPPPVQVAPLLPSLQAAPPPPPVQAAPLPPPVQATHDAAPPEVPARKGLSKVTPPQDLSRSFWAPNEFSSSTNIHEAPTWRAINTEADVEVTFVSPQDAAPDHEPPPVASAETISLSSIPEGMTLVPRSTAGSSDDSDFDDASDRPTLLEYPPPTSMVDVKSAISALASVTSRDAIVELAFSCMLLFAQRVALFSARRDGFYGWLCNEAFASPEALRKVVIPNDQPSIMATAMTASLYLGPIPKIPAHEPLLAVMGKASRDVAVASVRVGGKVAAILVADELRDTLSSTRRMDELARAMGDALTRLVKARG